MRTSQHESVNLRISLQNCIYILLYKESRPRRIHLVILHDRHPHGTSLLRDQKSLLRMNFGNLQQIRLRRHGPRSCQDTDMPIPGKIRHSLDAGTNNP